MIWLSLVSFLVTAVVAGGVVRWTGCGGMRLCMAMPCPSAFTWAMCPAWGAAVLLGMGRSWLLGLAQSLWWGDFGSLRLGGCEWHC